MKISQRLMGFINVFESATNAKVKACFDFNELLFVVEEGSIARAIGKAGNNVRKISLMLKKKVKVVEFNDNIIEFIKNLLYPLNGKIYKKDNKVVIEAENSKTKGLLLGRDRQNLKILNEVISSFFKEVLEIR